MKKENKNWTETREQFISRMFCLIAELHNSDKGNPLDYMKLVEFHLKSRESILKSLWINELQMYIYENVDGNKQKLLNQTLDIYANKKK